uniref:Secreted protein n=1 Tax=Cacopsylla melanoneura TaxID=428564 RepID=A0A8D8YQZ9_9HEMI
MLIPRFLFTTCMTVSVVFSLESSGIPNRRTLFLLPYCSRSTTLFFSFLFSCSSCEIFLDMASNLASKMGVILSARITANFSHISSFCTNSSTVYFLGGAICQASSCRRNLDSRKIALYELKEKILDRENFRDGQKFCV